MPTVIIESCALLDVLSDLEMAILSLPPLTTEQSDALTLEVQRILYFDPFAVRHTESGRIELTAPQSFSALTEFLRKWDGKGMPPRVAPHLVEEPTP